MFIEVSKNNGKDYLRLAKSNRVMNDKGAKVARNTVIRNIGPLYKFDDGQPNYIERLRRSFKAGQPLIAALEPYCSKETPREKYKVLPKFNTMCTAFSSSWFSADC